MSNIGTPYPDDLQCLLIKAALYDNGKAVSAWNEWSAEWDLEGYLDRGSFRLLPLVYRNLARLHVRDSKMPTLKGIYKQSWYKNNQLFSETKSILLRFSENNIPVIILKGAALIVLYYNDIGVRPMADIDILVPISEAERSIQILRSMGFSPEFEDYLEYNLRHGRSMMFRNEAGFELDLHWRPLFESNRSHESEMDFWNQAVNIDFQGVPSLTLCASDQLLHTLVHGVKWNPEPPIRWVTDAAYIVKSGMDPAEWKRFVHHAKLFQVILKVREALNYLRQYYNTPVPEWVLHDLNRAPVSLAEKVIFRFDKTDTGEVPETLIKKTHLLFVGFLRQTPVKGFLLQNLAFVSYLLYRTKGKKHLKILGYYLRKALVRKSKAIS